MINRRRRRRRRRGAALRVYTHTPFVPVSLRTHPSSNHRILMSFRLHQKLRRARDV